MFIQQCYMRCKNSEQTMHNICTKLCEFGYAGIISRTYNIDYEICAANKSSKRNKIYEPVIHTNAFDFDIHFKTTKYLEGIDCGTNKDLFFAIAALRNNSDYMQWFTDGKTWKVSNWKNAKPHLNDWYKYFGYTDINAHKATVEELIKYFK